jgi:peptide-methionine (S)-S-oxide reductase
MILGLNKKSQLPSEDAALPGRQTPMTVDSHHFVNGNSIKPPFPEDIEQALFGLGCFWGAERKFWELAGVYSTAVGYAGGLTPNPSYEEVCTGMTGHNEVVLVNYNPGEISFKQLLSVFWESHNPTQGMQQGNDTGTQYRSGIYVFNEQQEEIAHSLRDGYQVKLDGAGFSSITTEIIDVPEFYYAETYHQQYLAKNPAGYCGLGGTGVSCSNQ